MGASSLQSRAYLAHMVGTSYIVVVSCVYFSAGPIILFSSPAAQNYMSLPFFFFEKSFFSAIEGASIVSSLSQDIVIPGFEYCKVAERRNELSGGMVSI